MSIHINASKDAIAKTVLLAGDPLRIKYMAERFLEAVELVSDTRNQLYYTGTYKNKRVTLGSCGMGCPSMGIYSYELYTEFEVETIIRIGTCGAYSTELALYDLINVEKAVSESGYALQAWGIEDKIINNQGDVFNAINKTTKTLSVNNSNFRIKSGIILTSDVFYSKTKEKPALATSEGCMAVEMETFALFANAQYLQKNAAAILTVSDIIPTSEMISADEREKMLIPMMHLSLETVIQF